MSDSLEGASGFENSKVPECIRWLQQKRIPEHLYASYSAAQSRVIFWGYMINPESAPEHEREFFREARTRLDVIFTNGDTATNEKPLNAHLFTEEEFPNYEKEGNILHFVNTAACVQRYQKSKLCYLHADAMVQYYAIASYRKKNHIPISHNVLDIASFIKEKFDNGSLERHIFQNEGGRSVKELQRILHPKSKLKRVDITDLSGIIYCLRTYGPALVSNFIVHNDFLNEQQHKHYGPVPIYDEVPRGHAMVMVGYKFEENRHIFLLQNWWLHKQFVEVDSEYLADCDPVLHWVITEQPSIPDKIPFKIGSWMETEAAEFLDGYELEEDYESDFEQ